jgi:hypothetical protein
MNTKLTKYAMVLSNVKRVVFQDYEADSGLAAPDGSRPPQREWACMIDTPEGPQVVCSIYSVSSEGSSPKVLAISPYDRSKMCTVCEMMDAAVDNQSHMDALLTQVLTTADEVEPMTPEDDVICEDAQRFVCDGCHALEAENEERDPFRLMLN